MATSVPHSKSRHAFDQDKKEVEALWKIHAKAAGSGVGRKHGVEILNRTAMVFISAIWEVYAESLALEVYRILETKGKLGAGTPSTFVKAKRVVKGLNTPRSAKVKKMMKAVLGLKDLKKAWGRATKSRKRAAAKLDRFVGDRCTVAHMVRGKTPFSKAMGRDFLSHVEALVQQTDAFLFEWAKERIGRAPWNAVKR